MYNNCDGCFSRQELWRPPCVPCRGWSAHFDFGIRRVRYILNVTREIDNFFPGVFEYHNIRVFDEEATNLLEYWNETYKFISKAKYEHRRTHYSPRIHTHMQSN